MTFARRDVTSDVVSDVTSPVNPLDEPATQYLSVADGTIAYDDVGAGQLVICLPSLGDVRAEYRFLRPHLLAAGYRVVTMDLRGHGASSVGWPDFSKAAIGSDLVALIQCLGAGPALVVGTSYAAGSAVWAAAEAPDQVAGIVLIGAFVRDAPGSAVQKRILNLMLARPWGPSMWSMYFSNFYPSQKPSDFAAYRARLKANLAERGRIEALKAMLNADNAGIEARLDRVNAPALVVMGTKDPDFKDPVAEAYWIAGRVRGTALLVEGAGHYPHAEMPDRVDPNIVRFAMDATSSHIK